MDEQKAKSNKWVNTITNFAQMRFTPEYIRSQNTNKANDKLVERIKTMIPWSPRTNSQGACIEKQESEQLDSFEESLPQLHFARKLTAQHILIGNNNQLDLISIHSASLSFLDTEHLWSIDMGKMSIDLICVDTKKCLLVLANKANKKIRVYHYHNKKIHKKAVKTIEINLTESPKDISILKDLLIVVFQTKICCYTINSPTQIAIKEQLPFQFPQGVNYDVFKVPQTLDNYLNIFFSQDKPHSSTFVLWMVEFDYIGNKIKLHPAQKIYDIKKSLKKKIKIRNSTSKGTFIMNLGSQILTFKKGYIIDSVNINIKIEDSYLKYIGQNTLVHFSNKRFEIYDYEFKTNVKPYKVMVKSRDSMEITIPQNAIFFDAISVYNDNILVILQVKPTQNKKLKGQFNYWLAITQPILLEQKIDMLFPLRRISNMSDMDLNNRIEMAGKMGMSNRDIYLQLWNRSAKLEKNFPLLISTRHYKTIQDEVVRMLKKTSLNFSQIYKIERSSSEMLKQFVFSSSCTKEVFFGYISSNYLIKKLEYFRDVVIMNRESGKQYGPLLISIKKYYDIKEMHLVNHLVNLAKDLCFEDKPVVKEIRLFLYMFRIQLSTVYEQLLKSLVSTLKGKFCDLIKAIPELLPYEYNEQESKAIAQMPSGCSNGIWKPLNKSERKEIMCIDNLSTVDNREVIIEGIKDLWFRRASMSGHYFITEHNQTIQQIFTTLNSETTFYNVIQLVVNEVEDTKDRRQIFSYIETKYQNKLNHLKNRINLYNLIYYYLESRNILPQKSPKVPYTFKDFLSLKDDMLLFHLFKTEKTRKGLILKQIKPIFDQNNKEGQNMFNDFLLNYFKSGVSQISDIKYLLNRINNEKKEFHMKNQSMYSVLVEAMTIKLMVGTDDDIPLSEILIYIENIPIQKNNDVLKKLTTISAINRNAYIMQEARVNMSIIDIIQNPQQLMIKIIDHLLQKFDMYNETVMERQFEISYQILANLEYLHNEICKEESQSTFYIFFIYLIRLAESKSTVQHIRALINDQHLSKEFNYDASIVESLVIYLYKAKLNEQPQYKKNFDYLRTILTLLPDDNQIRQYIICEFQIANMLSSPIYKVQYPLSYRHASLGMPELQSILSYLKADEILAINIEQLTTLIMQMYNLNSKICAALNFIDDQQKSQLLSSVFYRGATSELTRKQVYQIFMMRLLSLKRLRQILPIMEIYFSDMTEIVQSDITYPILLLVEMENDLNYECKELFFLATCYLFKKPNVLFQLIKEYMITPFSTKDRATFLRNQVLNYKQNLKGFNIQNKMLNQQIINIAIIEGLQDNLFNLLVHSFKHLVNSRQDFRQYSYAYIYAILINSPYVLSKFLLCSRKYNTIRNIRLFLTYMTKEKVFDKLATMQVGYRIFLLVLYCLKDEMELEEVAHRFTEYPLDEDLPDDFEPIFDQEVNYFQILAKSYSAFKEQKRSQLKKIKLENEESQIRNKQLLLEPQNAMGVEPIEYSDIEMEESADQRKSMILIERKPQKFNEGEEIKKAINSKVKGKRSAKKVMKKRAFEEDMMVLRTDSAEDQQMYDDDIERPLIRILPEIGNPENSHNEFIREHLDDEDEDQPNANQNFLDSQEEKMQGLLNDTKIKDIIKKSSLSARDVEEKPSLSDCEVERQNQTVKIAVSERVRPQRESNQIKRDASPPSFRANKMSNVYYDNSDIQPPISEVGKKQFDKISVKSGQNPRSISQQSKRPTSRKDSFVQDEDFRSTKGGMKKSLPITNYRKIQGFPPVEEVGKKLYQQNLISFQSNNKKKKYKIDRLQELEKKVEFSKYLQEIMKYIYYESNDSSLEGIVNFIEYLILKYKLPYNVNHLNIWKRSEKLYKRYDSDNNPRKTLRIQAAFRVNVGPLQIFQFMENSIFQTIDDANVYKIAKMMGMTFLSDEVEHEIMYNYLLILSQRFTNEKDVESVNQQHQKLSVVIKKLPMEILSSRFNEFYCRADYTKKEQVLKMVVDKVKKSGTKEQKIQLLTQVVEYEPSEQGFLDRLTRSKK